MTEDQQDTLRRLDAAIDKARKTLSSSKPDESGYAVAYRQYVEFNNQIPGRSRLIAPKRS